MNTLYNTCTILCVHIAHAHVCTYVHVPLLSQTE